MFSLPACLLLVLQFPPRLEHSILQEAPLSKKVNNSEYLREVPETE